MNQFTSLLKRPVAFLVIVTLLAGLAALIYSLRQPLKYETSISFAANRINQGPTNAYEYDGYYAIQAADLFSQTVVSWFSTPSVLKEVYERAGVDTKQHALNDLTHRFSTKKFAAQNIVVTFSEASESRAQQIAQAVIETMQTRAAALNQASDKKALFELVGTKPLIVPTKPNVPLMTFGGLLAGFLAALSVVSLTAYLRGLAAKA